MHGSMWRIHNTLRMQISSRMISVAISFSYFYSIFSSHVGSFMSVVNFKYLWRKRKKIAIHQTFERFTIWVES